MYDVIVVGAGIFGQTISRRLRRLGMDVLTLDAGEERAGSVPSAGLMKPSWFSGLGKDFDRGLAEVAELWGLEEVELEVQLGPLGKTEKFLRLDMAAALAGEPVSTARVTSLGKSDGGPLVYTEAYPGEPYEAARVVVAAGVWSGQLVPVPGLCGKTGVAFTWEQPIERPFVRPWAPYKQVVALNLPDGRLWAGDGSAILDANWTDERLAASLTRCSEAVGRPASEATARVGIRPFIKGRKVAHLERAESGAWVATGGGKTGALGAGLCSAQLAEALA